MARAHSVRAGGVTNRFNNEVGRRLAQDPLSPVAARPLPKHPSVDILQRFPTTQHTQAGAVEPYIFFYLGAVGPGILPKRPAYCLAQEEFP